MTEPIPYYVGSDGIPHVTVEEYQRVRRKKELFQSCLVDIAHRMNEMADEIEQLQAEPWAENTAPAPLEG